MALHAGWMNGNNAACSTVGINATSSGGAPAGPGAKAGAAEGGPTWPGKMEEGTGKAEEGRVEKMRRERRTKRMTEKRSDMAIVFFLLLW